jgi:hypothetical protein
MTYAEMKDAIARALPQALPGLRAQLYDLNGTGLISDQDAGELDDAIEARRTAGRATPAPSPMPAGLSLGAAIAPTAERVHRFARQRRQTSPDRAKSRARVRLISRARCLPDHLSARYTNGQAAVLGVVGDETPARGVCALSIAEIAARAGVCHRLAQTTLRLAEGDGLVTITERPRKGQKHQTNLVRVLSREWAAWLAKRRPTGCRQFGATEIEDSSFSLESKGAARGSVATGFRRGDSGSGAAGRAAARPRF